MKEYFLRELAFGLRDLPTDEKNDIINYYGEMIDDKMASGLSELEAVQSIGNIEEIIKKCKDDVFEKDEKSDSTTSQKVTVENTPHSKREPITVNIVQLIFWVVLSLAFVPFLGGLIGLVFGLTVGFFAIVFSIIITGWALILSGFACLVLSVVLLFSNFAVGLVQVACCLAVIGVGFILASFTNVFIKLCIKTIKLCFNTIKFSYEKLKEVYVRGIKVV